MNHAVTTTVANATINDASGMTISEPVTGMGVQRVTRTDPPQSHSPHTAEEIGDPWSDMKLPVVGR